MPTYFAQDMQDAVRQASSYAESEDTVLLAPACASFDQFDSYAARGDAFRKAVGGVAAMTAGNRNVAIPGTAQVAGRCSIRCY